MNKVGVVLTTSTSLDPPRIVEDQTQKPGRFTSADAGIPTSFDIDGEKCSFVACDVLIVATYVAGDLMGGGRLKMSLFSDDARGFADLGFTAATSTGMYFPRRRISNDQELLDVMAQNNLSVPEGKSHLSLLSTDVPDAHVKITVESVGLGGSTWAVPNTGTGASYFFEVYINTGSSAGSEAWVRVR